MTCPRSKGRKRQRGDSVLYGSQVHPSPDHFTQEGKTRPHVIQQMGPKCTCDCLTFFLLGQSEHGFCPAAVRLKWHTTTCFFPCLGEKERLKHRQNEFLSKVFLRTVSWAGDRVDGQDSHTKERKRKQGRWLSFPGRSSQA